MVAWVHFINFILYILLLLQHFYFIYFIICNLILQVVKQLPQLKTVELVHNKCQNFDDVLNSIIGKSNLKKLTIVHYQSRHLNLKTITSLRHLEFLQLMGDIILKDRILISVSRNCISLTSIILGSKYY